MTINEYQLPMDLWPSVHHIIMLIYEIQVCDVKTSNIWIHWQVSVNWYHQIHKVLSHLVRRIGVQLVCGNEASCKVFMAFLRGKMQGIPSLPTLKN